MSRAHLTTPPDWVMLGVPVSDGTVAIYASKTLTQAEIEVVVEEIEEPPRDGFRHFRAGRKTMTMHVVGTDLVRATGPTYADALAALLAEWRPDERPAAAQLDAGQTALTSG